MEKPRCAYFDAKGRELPWGRYHYCEPFQNGWSETVSRYACIEAGLLQPGQTVGPTAEQVRQWVLDGVLPAVPAEFGPVSLP